ncbi:MAG: hypothetical protein K9J06_15065 [Flavobacteriales bacterium]|nr:hypothetical protein [Flavobacteriales bacterium]
MMEWAVSLSFVEKVYWASAILATGLFLVLTVLAFLGVDGDAQEAVDVEVEDPSLGSQFFTFKSMLGFFMLFGWSGLGCMEMGLPLWVTALLSVFAGGVMMFVTATIFYGMSRMTDNGTMRIKNAVNSLGEVYLIIPASRSGVGKVQITVQGALRELDAMTDDADPIPTGSIVKVIDIINERILLVTRK